MSMPPVTNKYIYIPSPAIIEDSSIEKQTECNEVSEWKGIKFDEVGIFDFLRDTSLPVVDVDQLLNSLDLEQPYSFKGEPPIKFTFKSAVQIVKYVIQTNTARYRDPLVSLHCPGIGGDLLRLLLGIETKKQNLMPDPPYYGGMKCSAQKSDLHCWLGAILQMLYEQKFIREYGRKGFDFWVKK